MNHIVGYLCGTNSDLLENLFTKEFRGKKCIFSVVASFRNSEEKNYDKADQQLNIATTGIFNTSAMHPLFSFIHKNSFALLFA